jgi:hypothetical protein
MISSDDPRMIREILFLLLPPYRPDSFSEAARDTWTSELIEKAGLVYQSYL